ncbi:putative oxidoreductase [Helianthus anomalus]
MVQPQVAYRKCSGIRKQRVWVASVEVPLFVTFHFINAYEEKDEEGRIIGVIADCCEHYADTTILDNLRLQNLRSWGGEDVLPDARYTTIQGRL